MFELLLVLMASVCTTFSKVILCIHLLFIEVDIHIMISQMTQRALRMLGLIKGQGEARNQGC